ncbi:MAG: Fic family protein [Chitinophagales bacterium]
MDIKEFEAGRYSTQFQYKSFLPERINKEWIVSDPAINTLLEEANLKLGALDAFSIIVPDVEVFIRMHIVKEATKSSRIEGTQTHIEEALQKQRDINPEKRDDWQEVQNYIEAMNFAIAELENLPLSSRLFRKTHEVLLDGVRGKHKMPGEYRKSQNWIGGSSLKDAVFIPPPHEEVDPLMGDLENFVNNDSINVPHLIRIAIAHYQFETIHPFLDGNGRLGRLMITLYLVRHKILHKPTLYLSDFFEKNKELYYDNLTVVRSKNNLTQWIKYFLVAVVETAKQGADTFKEILKLREELEGKTIITLGKKLPFAKQLLTHLYKHPVITALDIEEDFNVSKATANNIIKDFQRLEILKEQTGFKRNRIFLFERYLKLFER